MRRKDREIDDPVVLGAILDAAAELRLGMWDGEEPYVVPLNFVRMDGAIFFHSATSGRKMDVLRSFNRVCFEVTGARRIDPADGAHCTTRYESVIGWGRASLVEDAALKTKALLALNRKFGAGEGPFPPDLIARTAVIRVDIDRMTGKANRAS